MLKHFRDTHNSVNKIRIFKGRHRASHDKFALEGKIGVSRSNRKNTRVSALNGQQYSRRKLVV